MKEQNKVFLFYRRIFFYLKQHRNLSILLMLFTILMVLFFSMIPLLTKAIFDNALANKDLHLFSMLLGTLIFLLVFLVILWIASDTLHALVGVRICQSLKLAMFKKIHDLSFLYYSQNTEDDLLRRFAEHFSILTYTLTRIFWQVIESIMFLIIASGILIYLNWRMSVLVFLMMLLVFLSASKISKLSDRYLSEKEKIDSSLFQLIREDIDFHETVAALRLKKYRTMQFEQKLPELEKKDFLYNAFVSITATMIGSGVVILRLILIALGSYWVFKGTLTFGDFFAFLTMYISFAYSVADLSQFYPALMQAASGLSKIEELIHLPTESEEEKNLPDLPALSKNIRFNQICFGYAESTHTLKNISFNIFPGESIGIIGASGSGKSTLLAILLRRIMPGSGQIELDGRNIWQYSEGSLLSQFGIVSRYSELFSMSVSENIRMGKLDAQYEEIISAAKAAEIHDEIVALPEGYNTLVSRNENHLSSGQMQRIVLARALISNPRVLVLDEATSALDLYNQDAISKTLQEQASQRTTIIVTHHLREVVNLDKIIFLNKGEILEMGTHTELIQAKGKYHALWEKQTGIDISLDKKEVKIKLDWLKKIPLFSSFSDDLLNFCISKFTSEEAKPGQIIFEENTIGKKFYIIVKGSVLVSKKAENGQRKKGFVLENGDFFGEIALLFSLPRTARITTVETCSFLVLRQEHFAVVLSRLPAEMCESFKQAAYKRLEDLE